jgi:putative transposase
LKSPIASSFNLIYEISLYGNFSTEPIIDKSNYHNPFSEAQFRTMKYQVTYPATFGSEETARTWLQDFFTWYNHEHYHSGLNLFTPASVHYGTATAIQNQRQSVMNAAFARHPERFSLGLPQVKGAPDAVYINPPKHSENLV